MNQILPQHDYISNLIVKRNGRVRGWVGEGSGWGREVGGGGRWVGEGVDGGGVVGITPRGSTEVTDTTMSNVLSCFMIFASWNNCKVTLEMQTFIITQKLLNINLRIINTIPNLTKSLFFLGGGYTG